MNGPFSTSMFSSPQGTIENPDTPFPWHFSVNSPGQSIPTGDRFVVTWISWTWSISRLAWSHLNNSRNIHIYNIRLINLVVVIVVIVAIVVVAAAAGVVVVGVAVVVVGNSAYSDPIDSKKNPCSPDVFRRLRCRRRSCVAPPCPAWTPWASIWIQPPRRCWSMWPGSMAGWQGEPWGG